MKQAPTLLCFAVPAALCCLAPPALAEESFKPSTAVEISGGSWRLNGKTTHAGSEAEGLLLNVRMVNCTFEDRNPATCPKGFDPEKNTGAFLTKIPEYVAHGVSAFTLSLQGGSTGYEGALNSAFEPDGSLRPSYLRRVARVIEECDRQGAAVILGLFYQRQDQVLKDGEAVKSGVRNAAAWVKERGYTNVLIEIANEHGHGGFDHTVIKDPVGMKELIGIAHGAAPGILVSTSGLGDGRLDEQVESAADFLLLHFNSTPVAGIGDRVARARKLSKVVVCNEDDKTGDEGVKALQACLDSRCSWGYMNVKKNQEYPFTFEGAVDDPKVYARLKAATMPGKGARPARGSP